MVTCLPQTPSSPQDHCEDLGSGCPCTHPASLSPWQLGHPHAPTQLLKATGKHGGHMVGSWPPQGPKVTSVSAAGPKPDTEASSQLVTSGTWLSLSGPQPAAAAWGQRGSLDSEWHTWACCPCCLQGGNHHGRVQGEAPGPQAETPAAALLWASHGPGPSSISQCLLCSSLLGWGPPTRGR